MTQHPELFAALAAPFTGDEVKVRSTSGRQLHYITARTAMNRLDNVVGPENWWDRYTAGENSVLCELTIRLPDGSLLTKCDAGGYAGMADSGDDDKSGYSDAFKRAAVKFGVARYLYRDGVAEFGPDRPADQVSQQLPVPSSQFSAKNGKARHDWPNKGPGTAGVSAENSQLRTENSHETHAPDNRRRRGADGPETGGQLYAWCCQTQRKLRRDAPKLLPHLNGWAKAQGYPGRISDWSGSQVAAGYAEACRLLEQAG